MPINSPTPLMKKDLYPWAAPYPEIYCPPMWPVALQAVCWACTPPPPMTFAPSDLEYSCGPLSPWYIGSPLKGRIQPLYLHPKNCVGKWGGFEVLCPDLHL